MQSYAEIKRIACCSQAILKKFEKIFPNLQAHRYHTIVSSITHRQLVYFITTASTLFCVYRFNKEPVCDSEAILSKKRFNQHSINLVDATRKNDSKNYPQLSSS
jgi:hypothetical protein